MTLLAYRPLCIAGPLQGGSISYPPGARLHERTMRDFEFVWIQSGTVTWHVNGASHRLEPGAIVLSRPGFRDGYTWDPREPTRHGFVHFSPEATPADLPPADEFPILRQGAEAELLRPLLAFIVNQLPLGVPVAPGPVLGRALDALLAAFVLGAAPSPARAEPIPEPVHQALALVGRTLALDPAAPMTLRRVAEAGHVSDKHLCRLFRETLGQSPMEVVRALRLRQAVALLGRSDLKLEQIARHCGFKTVHHFSRQFSAVYGMPPGQARRDLANGHWLPPDHVRFAHVAVEF